MDREILNRLISLDGILAVAVSSSDAVGDISELKLTSKDTGAEGPFYHVEDGEWEKLARIMIGIARFSGKSSVEAFFGDTGRSDMKIAVCLWPRYHVAVKVVPGHPVTKSLKRSLIRVGLRHGGAVKMDLSVNENDQQTGMPAEQSHPPSVGILDSHVPKK